MASTAEAFSSGKPAKDHSITAWILFIQALAARFIHRVRTGGIRFLVQLILANLAFILLFRVLIADRGHRYEAVFPWAKTPEKVIPAIEGDLRIVAFGSQDVFGSAERSDMSRRTWLQSLCDELQCSSLHSFVPPHDAEKAMAFTDAYRKQVDTLEKGTEEADLLKTPAADYSWLEPQYPVPSSAPDLMAQVKDFLSLPAPDKAPRQTLWVFSFGTWDIWNLAALPMDQGLPAVIETIDKIVEQMEMLLFKSLDPESVAFSDFWFNATKEQVEELAAVDAADRVDRRRLENFRVLIPELFDMSLTPGWQNRPAPLFPHTKGEQTRNAAVLTKLWNSTVKEKLMQWELLEAAKPNVTENADGSITVAPIRVSLPFDKMKKRSEMDERSRHKREIIYASYPHRMAYQSPFAKDVVEAMTEEGMQRANVEDSLGRGTRYANDSMRFLDVWSPCLTADEGSKGTMTECQNPQDHLFLDGFTLNQRASDEIAKWTAEEVIHRMFRSPTDGIGQ